MNLDQLEKKIKIKFKNKNLLVRSITHKSYNSKINNEKLEFLGDRVLGLVIAKKLLNTYPDDNEGVLDKKFASLVNKKKCLEIGKNFNLEKIIKTNTSHNKNSLIEDKIISDTCEAIIGAIFFDQGIKIAEKFILNLWSDHILKSKNTEIDSKTRLQEYALKKFKLLPEYNLMSSKGPRHKPIFEVKVKIKNYKSELGKGSSKKDAEQQAAFKLIKKIGI